MLPVLLAASVGLLVLKLSRAEPIGLSVASPSSAVEDASPGAPSERLASVAAPRGDQVADAAMERDETAGAAVCDAAVTHPIAAEPTPREQKPEAKKPAAKEPAAGQTRNGQPRDQRQPRLAPAPPGAQITITAVGDIVMGTTARPGGAEGGARFFRAVEAELAGDVVLGNLEGTLSKGGVSHCASGPPVADADEAPEDEERAEGEAPTPVRRSQCFAFQMPPSHARWLKRAGFTVMNIANNHAWDYGPSGRWQTVKALKGVGIAHTGRRGQITMKKTNGVRIAIVGFSPDHRSPDLRDIPAARALVRKAAKKAHVVVVTMHAGAEGPAYAHVRPGVEYFLGSNRGDTVRFARAVVDAGADLVIGHGPHVLRGLEWYKGRLIAYSLGNFGAYRVFNLSGNQKYGAILKVRLNGDGSWAGGQLIPTYLRESGLPALDPDRHSLRLVRLLSRQDFGANAVRVAKGELIPPRQRAGTSERAVSQATRSG